MIHLQEMWELVYAPIGVTPDSCAVDVNELKFDLKRIDRYGCSYIQITISTEELNKMRNSVKDGSTFCIYGLIKLNNGSRHYDNCFLKSVYLYSTFDKADHFNVVNLWERDCIYSSDFTTALPLDKLSSIGNHGFRDANTYCLQNVAYNAKNIVEIYNPYSGKVLQRFTYEDADAGKIKASAFADLEVPCSDFSEYVSYNLTIYNDPPKDLGMFIGLSPYSKLEIRNLLREKVLKGYANYRILSPKGSILANGTIQVNSILGINSYGCLWSLSAFNGKTIPWDMDHRGKPGVCGLVLGAYDVDNIYFAFDPYIFRSKYNVFWEVREADGSLIDIAYDTHESNECSYSTWSRNFWVTSDFNNYGIVDAQRFSKGTVSLIVNRKDSNNVDSKTMSVCDSAIEQISESGNLLDVLKGIDLSLSTYGETYSQRVKEFTLINRLYNALGEDITKKVGNINVEFGTLNGLGAVQLNWDEYTPTEEEIESGYWRKSFENEYKDACYFYSYGDIVENYGDFKQNNPYGSKNWYNTFDYTMDTYRATPLSKGDVPSELQMWEQINNRDISATIDTLTRMGDYGVLHNQPFSGILNSNSFPYHEIQKLPCMLHNDCIATWLYFVSNNCGVIWTQDNNKSNNSSSDQLYGGVASYTIRDGKVESFNYYRRIQPLLGPDRSLPFDAMYFIGCQKGGSTLGSSPNWKELRTLSSFSTMQRYPFEEKYSWPIGEFKLNKRLFGIAGTYNVWAPWVFELDDVKNFLYDNLSPFCGGDYRISYIHGEGSNWVPQGGAIWPNFANYIRSQHQAYSSNPFYDEEFINLVSGASPDTYRQVPPYVFMGPFIPPSSYVSESTLSSGGSDWADAILVTNPVSSNELLTKGFWDLRSSGFKSPGLWTMAIGTFRTGCEYNAYVPVYVNGFNRNIYTPDDIKIHENLISVVNSNSRSPDTYTVAAQDDGYTLYDMLRFETSFYHPDVYRVRWVMHYTDEQGVTKTITLQKATEEFGLKFTPSSLSRIIKLQIDCSDVKSNVNLDSVKFQAIVYKLTQRYTNKTGGGFTDWEVDDSDPYWVPSNTDVTRLGGGEPRNANVIASVGNFWGVTIKSTATAKSKDMVVWDFVKDPASYSKSAKWFIGKVDSKLSNVTVSTTGWGSSNCTYTIKKANGTEAYKGKVSFLSPTASTGNLNENTYGWTFNQEIPDYLASDLKIFYMDEPVGGKAMCKVDSSNKKKILLQGLQDSQFRAASEAVIAKLTTENYESLTGVWVGAPIPYTTSLGAPLYPAGEETLFDASNHKNGWSVPIKLSGIFRWDGDSAPTDGSTIKDSSGNTVTPGSKLTPGEYTVIKDGEEHTMYVNGVARKNKRNMYLKSGDNTSELAFTFKYPVQLNSDGSFLWYGIQGQFGLKDPIGGAFTPFGDAVNGMKAPWTTYFTATGSCSGFSDSTTTASYILKGAKSSVDGMEFGAKVGGDYSESYSIFVQPDAVIQVKLERIE